jgi:hypothetical protein
MEIGKTIYCGIEGNKPMQEQRREEEKEEKEKGL